ncbi:MAG: hypothetical protein HC895_25705 [Leptolyngbyaceae cyanobacterium SM1_3_5]|nr:hypothetical protein [Leptolyngbyaceae cyanobacterium SM1_3_5]
MFPAKHLTPLAAIALLLGLSAGKAIASPSADIKAKLFSEIGFEYAALGSDRALEVFDQAQQSIDEMTNRCYQANPVLRVGGGYWLLERAEGDRLLNEAIEIAQAQEKTGCSSSATSPTESLANRAREFAKAGHLDLAIEISTKLRDPVSLAEFSTLLAEAGETERADEVLNQAIEFAQQFEVPGVTDAAEWRTMILSYMGEQLLAAERPEAARQVFDRALESIPAVESTALSPAAPVQVSLRLTTALAESGATQQAIDLLNQTIPTIRALRGNSATDRASLNAMIGGALVAAAIAHHELDQQDQAIALLVEDVVPERGALAAGLEEPVAREPILDAARMIEHLARISQWVLSDSASSRTLESFVSEVLDDLGGGVLFLFQGEVERPGIKFVVATEARWLVSGEELFTQVRERVGDEAEGRAEAFLGRLDGHDAWIACQAFTALERPYLFAAALPRFSPPRVVAARGAPDPGRAADPRAGPSRRSVRAHLVWSARRVGSDPSSGARRR